MDRPSAVVGVIRGVTYFFFGKIRMNRLNPFFFKKKSGCHSSTRLWCQKMGLIQLKLIFFDIKMVVKIATKHQMDPVGTFHTHPKLIFEKIVQSTPLTGARGGEGWRARTCEDPCILDYRCTSVHYTLCTGVVQNSP